MFLHLYMHNFFVIAPFDIPQHECKEEAGDPKASSHRGLPLFPPSSPQRGQQKIPSVGECLLSSSTEIPFFGGRFNSLGL